MSVPPRFVDHLRVLSALVLAAVCGAGCQNQSGPEAVRQVDTPAPPLEIEFGHSAGLPEGRQQAYDPQTGVFHVHFDRPTRIGSVGSGLYERTGFEVTKVAERFEKPVVFRLTGVPDNYGCVGRPLTFTVGDTSHALVKDALATGPVDGTLFRVGRDEGALTVAFTEKGRALLKPGARISFKVDTGW